MKLIQKKFSYSEYFFEEREFGRRQKQKAKIARIAHNAEMAENKAAKARLKAINLAESGEMEAAKIKAAEAGHQLNRASAGMDDVMRRADKLSAPNQERLIKKYTPSQSGTTKRSFNYGPIKNNWSGQRVSSGNVTFNGKNVTSSYTSPQAKIGTVGLKDLNTEGSFNSGMSKARRDINSFQGQVSNNKVAKELDKSLNSNMSRQEISSARKNIENQTKNTTKKMSKGLSRNKKFGLGILAGATLAKVAAGPIKRFVKNAANKASKVTSESSATISKTKKATNKLNLGENIGIGATIGAGAIGGSALASYGTGN